MEYVLFSLFSIQPRYRLDPERLLQLLKPLTFSNSIDKTKRARGFYFGSSISVWREKVTPANIFPQQVILRLINVRSAIKTQKLWLSASPEALALPAPHIRGEEMQRRAHRAEGHLRVTCA